MAETTPLLSVEDLEVTFRLGHGLRRQVDLKAVNGITLEVNNGETLAIVGESGSGKSTAARAILRLVPISGGRIVLLGDDITELRGGALREKRRQMQMVFQDPYSSLDPSAVVAEIIGEPLRVHEHLRGRERQRRVRELLDQVGLSRHHLERYSYEFSGGQRQRIAIARALAVNPALVVLDEAVSALDVSTQNQILQLLASLKAERGLSYVFISHDLGVVRWIADRTAVMYLGQIVESGPTHRVHDEPAHPYTQSLLSAMPIPDPIIQRQRQRIVLKGDPPDPLEEISGCPFRTRCPSAMDICAAVRPEPLVVSGGGWAACHLLTSEGAASNPGHRPGAATVGGG